MHHLPNKKTFFQAPRLIFNNPENFFKEPAGGQADKGEPEIINFSDSEQEKKQPTAPEPAARNQIIVDLQKSKHSQELKDLAEQWIEKNANQPGDDALLDRLKSNRNFGLPELMEVMGELQLRDPEKAKQFKEKPDMDNLLKNVLSDLAKSSENNKELENYLQDRTDLLNTTHNSLNQLLEEERSEAIKHPLPPEKPNALESLNNQKISALQQAKALHQSKLEQAQAALKSTEASWEASQVAQTQLMQLLDQKHYDNVYFSPEGSVVTVGEAKDQHLNDEGRAALDQKIQQAETQYYRLLDTWRENSAQSDKLIKEEEAAQTQIGIIQEDYDKRIAAESK